jgi:cell division protein ZapD
VTQNTPMSEAAEPALATAREAPPAPAPAGATLAFEQPLSERLRTYLRLDFLYNQALAHNQGGGPWSSRAAMTSLLDILAITTRADTRADVLKELERQLALMNEYAKRTGVDTARLRSIVANLMRLRTDLLGTGGNYLQTLKESEFVAAIRHRSAIPGGTCEFDLPDYSYWLHQPDSDRAAEFAGWLSLFRPLCDAIAELLWLTRQSGNPRQEIARGGVYHIAFDRDMPVQLVRVLLPADGGLYPEISGSHYRCSLRFVSWNGFGQRPTQCLQDVPFTLTCCT